MLAERLGLPFIPTDGVYWRADWTPVASDDVREWVEGVAAREVWVLDGNFDAQRDVLWRRAELAVWLDLPWTVTVWRVVWRNLRWWASRRPVWSVGPMSLTKAWGGVRHAARGHTLKRRVYPEYFAAFPELEVVHIRSAKDLRQWMGSYKPLTACPA